MFQRQRSNSLPSTTSASSALLQRSRAEHSVPTTRAPQSLAASSRRSSVSAVRPIPALAALTEEQTASSLSHSVSIGSSMADAMDNRSFVSTSAAGGGGGGGRRRSSTVTGPLLSTKSPSRRTSVSSLARPAAPSTPAKPVAATTTTAKSKLEAMIFNNHGSNNPATMRPSTLLNLKKQTQPLQQQLQQQERQQTISALERVAQQSIELEQYRKLLGLYQQRSTSRKHRIKELTDRLKVSLELLRQDV